MIDVFLSASVPLPDRDRRYFDTADVLSIREAIKALVEVVLPVGTITCGGHPAITPLLAQFAREADLRDRVTIYQSSLFEDELPASLAEFADVRVIPAINTDRAASLAAMRSAMITSREFTSAVIIGGMEGIFEELEMFVEYWPNASVLPIATTGAAASMVYTQGEFDPIFASDRTYPSLFRRKLLPAG